MLASDASSDFSSNYKSPHKKKKKKESQMKKTYRFNLVLNDADDKNYNEFNWLDLVAQEEESNLRKQAIGPLDPYASDDDDQIKAIAAQFEAKYGVANEIKKKKRKRKLDDYADLGYGYDSNDSFVDNSDVHDEIVPQNMTTAHGGFYINSGLLEFKERESAGEDSDMEAAFKEGEKMKKKRKNKKKEDPTKNPNEKKPEPVMINITDKSSDGMGVKRPRIRKEGSKPLGRPKKRNPDGTLVHPPKPPKVKKDPNGGPPPVKKPRNNGVKTKTPGGGSRKVMKVSTPGSSQPPTPSESMSSTPAATPIQVKKAVEVSPNSMIQDLAGRQDTHSKVLADAVNRAMKEATGHMPGGATISMASLGAMASSKPPDQPPKVSISTVGTQKTSKVNRVASSAAAAKSSNAGTANKLTNQIKRQTPMAPTSAVTIQPIPAKATTAFANKAVTKPTSTTAATLHHKVQGQLSDQVGKSTPPPNNLTQTKTNPQSRKTDSSNTPATIKTAQQPYGSVNHTQYGGLLKEASASVQQQTVSSSISGNSSQQGSRPQTTANQSQALSTTSAQSSTARSAVHQSAATRMLELSGVAPSGQRQKDTNPKPAAGKEIQSSASSSLTKPTPKPIGDDLVNEFVNFLHATGAVANPVENSAPTTTSARTNSPQTVRSSEAKTSAPCLSTSSSKSKLPSSLSIESLSTSSASRGVSKPAITPSVSVTSSQSYYTSPGNVRAPTNGNSLQQSQMSGSTVTAPKPQKQSTPQQQKTVQQQLQHRQQQQQLKQQQQQQLKQQQQLLQQKVQQQQQQQKQQHQAPQRRSQRQQASVKRTPSEPVSSPASTTKSAQVLTGTAGLKSPTGLTAQQQFLAAQTNQMLGSLLPHPPSSQQHTSPKGFIQSQQKSSPSTYAPTKVTSKAQLPSYSSPSSKATSYSTSPVISSPYSSPQAAAMSLSTAASQQTKFSAAQLASSSSTQQTKQPSAAKQSLNYAASYQQISDRNLSILSQSYNQAAQMQGATTKSGSQPSGQPSVSDAAIMSLMQQHGANLNDPLLYSRLASSQASSTAAGQMTMSRQLPQQHLTTAEQQKIQQLLSQGYYIPK